MGGESPRCGGLIVPYIAGAQQGLKGGGLGEGSWYPSKLWDQLWTGSWGPAQTGGRDPGGRGSGGVAKGWVFQHGVGLAAGDWCS
jgi:hypothetical protein